MTTRKERALKQRMYLLSAEQKKAKEWCFDIQGSTQKVYKVYISDKVQKCSCMDFSLRGVLCKHLIMVIGRIANDKETFSRIPIDNKTNIYSLNPQFDKILINRLKNRNGLMDSSKEITITSSEECIICFESMKKGKLQKCNTCRNIFHSECIQRWLKIKYNCPLCRGVVEYTMAEINDAMEKLDKLRLNT